MKLIESSVEYIPQGESLEGAYKQIEKCARTCYKSEDKIVEDSAQKMVKNLTKNHHTAMLEHGTIYLAMPIETILPIEANEWGKYINKYSKTGIVCEVNEERKVAVTTNLRVLVENGWLEDLKYICEPTEYHEKRYTFKFITSRGIANELVRHRVFSFAQESSRYCNYSKDKFENQVSFIIPSWLLGEVNECSYNTMAEDINFLDQLNHDKILRAKASWYTSAFLDAERCYLEALSAGSTPQEARDILPLSTKTELCMTGFQSDWERLLDIRYNESTGRVHPDMKILMQKLVDTIKQNSLEIAIKSQNLIKKQKQ